MRKTLLLLALLFALPLRAEPIDLRNYIESLQRLESAVRREDVSASRSAAAALLDERYLAGTQELSSDRSLLEPLTKAKTGADLRSLRPRLVSTIAALRSLPTTSKAAPADAALLARIASEQRGSEMKKGGTVATVPTASENLWEAIARQMRAMYDWLVKQLERIYDWLMRFWPRSLTDEDGDGAFFGLPFGVAVLVLVILALLLILALNAWRRSGKETQKRAAESTTVSSPSADEDPLSREASEWERYAAELAAAGRIREAIRAWYHAVLVSMYRTGLLHYRKGRTNWEYVSSLAPSLAWRPRFTALTRAFEREWYGRDRSTVEALESCASEARTLLDEIRRGAQ